MANFAMNSPFNVENGRHFLAIFIFTLVIVSTSQNQLYQSLERNCGALYAGQGNTGEKFMLKDGDQSVQLGEDHRASGAGGWNTTLSLNVESGCTLQVCNETYFDGVCDTLAPTDSISNVTSGEILSASCTCERECKCSDVFMKKSSCARAYLQGGCKTCNSLYTDLTRGGKGYFPDDFVGNVQALRIRKGCTLTLYPDEDHEGEEDIYETEIVEDYKGSFKSYECDCNDDEYVPRQKPPRPATFPPLVNIPATMDDVVKMLSDPQYAQHPGVIAAQRSLRGKRSSRNAYILLLGTTGSGKSSAINLLFDNPNVTRVGEEKSTTTNIHEFRIPVPIDELGIANSELRVIDTPGLGDTRGLEQDAKFLATLDDFLKAHEELKDRIPNVVLIFHKFHDNRFNGEGSSYVKMIRGFDSFRERITDENYSNVIFVLSHFGSETKATKRKPDFRLNQFKKVIENYSLFPKPTVISVAENKARDQEMPLVNGYYKLPNNEYYPRNLFEKMEAVTEHGGDMTGLGVFRTAFRDSEDFNVTSHTFELVSKESSNVEKYLRILSNAFFGVEKTEISQLLQTVWDEKVPINLRKQFPDSLHYLQKSLNIRNVNTKDDVPKTTTAILELLTAIKHDEATRTLLDKALNVKSPNFQHNTIAGFSYNVFKDTYLSTSPFVMGDTYQADNGFMIPKILTCNLEPGSREHFQLFDDKAAYLKQRVQSLGIEGDISIDSFTGQIKPGHNIKSISFKNDSCSLSATKEFRLFDFVLNDRLDLNPDFLKVVKGMPAFNETNVDNVDKWKAFFDEYGTHVVKSVHGGGAIEIQLNSDKPFNNDLAQALFGLVKFAEDMSYAVTDTDPNSNGTSGKTVLKEGVAHTLNFIGGDPAFHTNDLTKMSIENAAKLLGKWKKSLKFNPSVLTTEMRLFPLSQVVKKVGQNISAEIERATSLLFNSSLKYIPMKKTGSSGGGSGPGPDRDHTPLVTQLLIMQQKSDARMQELMMEMKKIEAQNQQRQVEMEQKRLEWEQAQKRMDQEYRLKQLEMQQASEDRKQQMEEKMAQERRRVEDQRRADDQRYQQQMRDAQAAADRRQREMMEAMNNRPSGGGGGCLKTGTKILMADRTEKSVEDLQVGDIVLDKDLNPTSVLGVAHVFFMDQKMYGFDNDSFFFTNSHTFVGPSGNGSDLKLYTRSTANLYHHNPLMKYMFVSDMAGSHEDKSTTLYHLNDAADETVDAKQIRAYEDPTEYSEDMPVYYLQVDSPTGTYFANGYVCRHEIPPFEHWPNTMGLLFRMLDTEEFQKFATLPYNPKTEYLLRDVFEETAINVKKYLERYNWETVTADRYSPMKLEDIDVDECMGKIYNNSAFGSASITMYSLVGNVLADYLDNELKLPQGQTVSEDQMAKLQHDVYEVIKQQLVQIGSV